MPQGIALHANQMTSDIELSAFELMSTHLPPSVPPLLITDVLRHRTDPNRRRATFSLAYPTLEVVLEKKADIAEKLPPHFENGRRTVIGIRFFFQVPDLFIGNCDFKRCKFHRPSDNGNSKIAGTRFADCTFCGCVFGGTEYRHVWFERCSFRRCDFGMSQFFECHFRECIFDECTGEHVSFSATEVSPDEMMKGMVVPLYNYGPDCEGEPSRKTLESQWLEIRRALAAQLLKSNGDVYHTQHSDAALVQLKMTELRVRWDNLRTRSFVGGDTYWVSDLVRAGFLWLILTLTKGGTSMARLVLLAILAIPTYALLLSVSSVTYQGTSCYHPWLHFSTAIKVMAYAASLFLAVGYTAFAGSTAIETVLLTAGAAIGLIWYALMAAVVIRRVYR
jgi:hypothetical protein